MTRARLLKWILVAIALAWLPWAFYSPPRPWPPPVPDVRVAQLWLECGDCRGPFLERLRDSRPPDRDTVLRLFRSALLFGPDSARRARQQEALMRAWTDDSLYRVRKMLPPASLDRATLLRTYASGLDVTWRVRAATALGVMGDSVVLDSALQLPLQTPADSEVREAVHAVDLNPGSIMVWTEP